MLIVGLLCGVCLGIVIGAAAAMWLMAGVVRRLNPRLNVRSKPDRRPHADRPQNAS